MEKGWEAEGRAVPSEPRQGWSLHVCKGSRDVGLAGREEGHTHSLSRQPHLEMAQDGNGVPCAEVLRLEVLQPEVL